MKYKYIPLLLFALIISGTLIWTGIKSSQHTSQKVTKHTPLPKEITVTLDKNGFSPKEVTIAVGSAVRWKNVSGKQQTVNSDNYPTNQLHKELNFGIFNSGSSVVYTFTTPGTYGYHNQFHHEQQGKIIVTKKE